MRRSLLTLTAGLTLLVAGCGGGEEAAEPADGAAAGGGAAELTPVTLGVIPILDVAPAYLCQERGTFEEHGLDVTFETAQGGAAIVPAVLSGQYAFGFSNSTSLLLGQSRGLPLQVVAPASSSTGEPGNDFASVVVPADSDIQSAADLAGRTVAINTLNNISDTVIRESVRKDGGDPSGVQFVELPFPDMPAALEAGRVDAVFVVEPFQTITQAAGGRPVTSAYAEATEDLQVAVYFTSDQYAQSDPDVVQAFDEAITECQEHASANPEEARQVLTTYTQIDPAIIPDLTLPAYATEVNRESIQVLADLAVEDGLIEEAPDLDQLLPE